MRQWGSAMMAAVGVWLCGLAVGSPDALRGQAFEEAEDAHKRFDFGFEIKAHYRESDDVVLPARFDNPVRPDERIMLRTVDPGEHVEVSAVTLFFDARLGRGGWFRGHVKLDAEDLYDRNPTSTDSDFDVDEAWIRFGHENAPAEVAERGGAYLKIGKFPHFERQDDRHLETYGLVSTAFNRMEDIGLEVGWRLGRHFYGRLSATQGNPLFFRDPTALAGDNGTPDILTEGDSRRGSGLAILYDFETESFDLGDRDPELGVGLGARFGDVSGARAADFLVWGYRRDLDASADIHGSFYGGDLDILRGPLDGFEFPISGDEKREYGANLWLYLGGFSLFAQYVDQEVAGLPRTGTELELAWEFELPLRWSVGGRALFPSIAPAVRWSELDNDFGLPPMGVTPSPSFAWDWEKIDLGVRIGILDILDLTAEYTINEFIRAGETIDNNETLVTLRLQM